MTKTRIFRLVPSARADDPNWDRVLNHGEVIVRAVSAGDARVVASYGEARAITLQQPKASTTLMASAFRNPKLYSVIDDTSGEFPEDGPRTVLRALFQVPDDFTETLPLGD